MVRNNRAGDWIGRWVFLVGFIIAIVFGAFGLINYTWTVILVIIGIIVGLLNIASRESESFLLAGLALIIASAFGQVAVSVVPVFSSILEGLMLIFVPATIIVALKHIFVMARD